MNRFVSLISRAAIGTALLITPICSNAATTYMLYLQPISSTTVTAGAGSVFQFRALIDIPPYAAGVNNGTIALTLGTAVSFDTAVTGPVSGTPNVKGKFRFTPDAADFAPLAALGYSGTPLWNFNAPSALWTTTNGTNTFQGIVGHTAQSNPDTGVTLTVPAGTYTLGTFTLPITGAGTMTISLTSAAGLTGQTASQDYINNTSGNGTATFTDDSVLTFPNDGSTRLSSITVRSVAASKLTGRVSLEGVNDFAPFTAQTAPKLTLQFRKPGATTPVISSAALPLFSSGVHTAYAAYDSGSIASGTYDVAYLVSGHLRVVIPNVTISGTTTVPDVLLLGGDANSDNVVDIADFGLLVNSYGGMQSVAGTNYDVRADFNYDGAVDIADFGILVNEYGRSGAN